MFLAHGAGATTRQLAEAAGVAEGTIFRVFPDKGALIDAVVDKVFDPSPTAAALAGIDLDWPLETRLEAAVRVLQERVATIWRLLSALGMVKPPERTPRKRRDDPDMQALVSLLVPDAARLRRDPVDAAQLLRGLTFACSHPALTDTPMAPTEIVDVFLHGVHASVRRRR